MTAVAEKPRQYRDVKLDPVQGPPDVFPSDPVLYYDGPAAGRVPLAGFVIRTNLGTSLEIAVFRPEFHNYRPVDGVKHKDDPTLRPDELEQKGCWDYHPRVRSMAAHKKLLDEALAVLTQPAAKK